MQKSLNLGGLIADVFKNNWEEKFVYEAASNMVLTYEEFFTEVNRYNRKLADYGLVAEDTLVLIMDNSLDLIILYFACLLAGIRIVPIDPFKGKEGIHEIFRQIDCQAVITDMPLADFAAKKIINLVELKKSLTEKITSTIDDLKIFYKLNYKKAYLVAFTSGSTGAPKGVIHSFENLIRSALSFGKRLNFGKENIFYHHLPMTYMAGILNSTFLPFIFSSKIVIGNRFGIATINTFWDYPIKYSVNTFWFNSTILFLLLNLDRGKKGTHYAASTPIIGCVGTAPLSYSLKHKFERKYKIALYESYGLSETLFISTEGPNEKRVEGSVGKVLSGAKIDFADDGEILQATDWMFLGYVNKVSGDAFKNNKFLSGDLGEIDCDSFLHITGRKKDLIIKGGINISPRKLEDFIGNFNFFDQSVIIGLADEVLGEKIVCFFTPDKKNYNKNSEKKINDQLITDLGKDYKIDEFYQLEEVPKNINGKIDKLKIKEDYFKNKKNDN